MWWDGAALCVDSLASDVSPCLLIPLGGLHSSFIHPSLSFLENDKYIHTWLEFLNPSLPILFSQAFFSQLGEGMAEIWQQFRAGLELCVC